MKIVINNCYGRFGFSKKAKVWLSKNVAKFNKYDIERTHPMLIQCIEKFGRTVNSKYSELEIIEIPDDVEWTIDNYGGKETIYEIRRSWP